jgi:hypothetical protein
MDTKSPFPAAPGDWDKACRSRARIYAARRAWGAGLLTSGLIPCMRHAIQNLMADDMLLLPASATVYVQAVEIRTGEVCGVDMSPVNQHRWHPGYLAGMS